MIVSATAANVTHPMHLHGTHFSVVAMEYGNGSFTLENIKARNEAGEIKKNLRTGPLKDNVSVPSRGFTIIRFNATNPGYWFFHCHVGVHSEEGMAAVLKVGDHSQMVHPKKDFDTCGNYNITAVRSPNQLTQRSAVIRNQRTLGKRTLRGPEDCQ